MEGSICGSSAVVTAFETKPEMRGKYLNGSEVQELVAEAADTEKTAMVWKDSVKYYQLTDQDPVLVHWARELPGIYILVSRIKF